MYEFNLLCDKEANSFCFPSFEKLNDIRMVKRSQNTNFILKSFVVRNSWFLHCLNCYFFTYKTKIKISIQLIKIQMICSLACAQRSGRPSLPAPLAALPRGRCHQSLPCTFGPTGSEQICDWLFDSTASWHIFLKCESGRVDEIEAG